MCIGTERDRMMLATITTQATTQTPRNPRTIPIRSWSEFPTSSVGGSNVPGRPLIMIRDIMIRDTPAATSGGKRVVDSIALKLTR